MVTLRAASSAGVGGEHRPRHLPAGHGLNRAGACKQAGAAPTRVRAGGEACVALAQEGCGRKGGDTQVPVDTHVRRVGAGTHSSDVVSDGLLVLRDGCILGSRQRRY